MPPASNRPASDLPEGAAGGTPKSTTDLIGDDRGRCQVDMGSRADSAAPAQFARRVVDSDFAVGAIQDGHGVGRTALVLWAAQ